MRKKPEILSPAGDFEKLRFAVAYGADAVYMAGKSFGMRTASGNFTPDEMAQAVEYCHRHGVKAYVTANTMPRDNELAALPEYLQHLDACGVDGIIAADLGVMGMVKRYAPHAELHVSTQTSIVNSETAKAYGAMGASRIVLARELSMEEIRRIRDNIPPELEIEAFVHGAMCMSYSGRCVLSNYLAKGRDANRGNCAQPCRWQYRVVEEYRPGEYMPIYEDESGTYIFNSKDMNMLGHIPELVDAGIDSLKIEGRVKTAYYAAVVTNAYRRALDLYWDHPESYLPPAELLEEVDKVSHREYFTGFYFGDKDSQHTSDSQYIRKWDVCAIVEECDAQGNARLKHKNKFSIGEQMELLIPGKPAIPLVLDHMEDETHASIELANLPGMTAYVKLPISAPPMAILRKSRNQ